jgi:hypothetical protein
VKHTDPLAVAPGSVCFTHPTKDPGTARFDPK